MAKTPNNNTVPKKSTKIVVDKVQKVSKWFDDYKDLFSLRVKPVTEAFIDRLAQELNSWSLLDSSIVLGDFLDERGIQERVFKRWMARHEDLSDAWELARRRLVSRREKGGLTRKYDPGQAFASLAKYDDSWKEYMQWKSNLSSNESSHEKVVIEINDLSKKVEITSDKKE